MQSVLQYGSIQKEPVNLAVQLQRNDEVYSFKVLAALVGWENQKKGELVKSADFMEGSGMRIMQANLTLFLFFFFFFFYSIVKTRWKVKIMQPTMISLKSKSQIPII